MNESTPITVTIFASGDGENTPAEAVHHALAYAHKAGFIEGWSDPEPLRSSAPQGDGRASDRAIFEALPKHGDDKVPWSWDDTLAIAQKTLGVDTAMAQAQVSEVRKIADAAAAALSAPPSVALEQTRKDLGIVLAALRSLEEATGEAFDDEDGVVTQIERDYAALTRPQPGGAVAGTAAECPHIKPPANLSEPCQICGALGPWFDGGNCAVAGTERGHDSCCALHNAPALPVGPCDCSLSRPVHGATEIIEGSK